LTDQLGRPVEHLYVTGVLAVVRDSKSARRPLLCLWSLATATFWRHTHTSPVSPVSRCLRLPVKQTSVFIQTCCNSAWDSLQCEEVSYNVAWPHFTE